MPENLLGFNERKRPLIHVVKEGRLTIGPELARRILNEAPYERQRKCYAHHVELLADSMRRGAWTEGSQIAFAYYQNRLHLVNGQHRMSAVIKSGRSNDFQVLIVPVDNETQLDELYYRFDVEQRKRSLSEVLNAAEVAQKHDLPKQVAKAVYEAAGLISNGLSRPDTQKNPVKARSVDARLSLANAWWPTAKKFNECIRPADKFMRQKLLRQGVTAVGLITLYYQEELAIPFWTGIAENDGLRKGDPRHTFIRDINNRALNQGSINQSVIVAGSAWSAYYEGRTIHHIKVRSDSVARIAGTPFSGERR